MSNKIVVVFVGNGIATKTLLDGRRETFERNVPKEVGEEDSVVLLKARGLGCSCHKEPAPRLFLSYDEWKESNK